MGTVTADAANHISGLTYDTSGNTLTDGNNTYTWNGESQLKTAGGVTYAYDGDGRRDAKVGSKLYWYGSGGEILAETNAAGVTLNDYVYFGGRRVSLVPATGSALFYAEDFLGSSRAMVQSTGTLCYDADFAPFGFEKTQTNTCPTNYKFEGKERDAETQNDDFGAREYSWRKGRWLSSDWSAVPYANLTNPQTLNLYGMVADDPESFADLDGHYQLNASDSGDSAKCQNKYDKAARKFEVRREKDSKSKKADVRAAAAAYGAKGEANGAHVGFANTAAQGIDGSVTVDPSGSLDVQVKIDFGRAGSSETITHEGTHVGDDLKFLNSYDPLTGGHDQSLNPTHGQTAFNAFHAGAEVNHEHGFGPNEPQKIWQFLRSSPTYGPILNIHVFDTSKFPASGVPDE